MTERSSDPNRAATEVAPRTAILDDALDPRGLIREAYRIDGIAEADCRSIFLDWALGLPLGLDPTVAIGALLGRLADEPADHPMTAVLREGLTRPTRTRPPRGRRAGAARPE